MPEVLDRLSVASPTVSPAPDELLARRALQGQIERLERELARLLSSSWPRQGIDWSVSAAAAGPRLLGLAELEEIRDAMFDRVCIARRELRTRALVEEHNRERIEDMHRDPRGHRWERVTSADLGEPGCRNVHVLPRLGIIGMMLDWWHVKVSSGCP